LFPGKILLTEFFNRDDPPDVTFVNNRPLIPCYEAEDLTLRPWWTDFCSLPCGAHLVRGQRENILNICASNPSST
jgi:hypothetical protein